MWIRLFESFFDDVSVDTLLANLVPRADASFEIANETIRLSLGMLLLNGCHKLPDRKMHSETPSPILLYKQCLIQCLVILLRVFLEVSIFVIMNNLVNKRNYFLN